MSRKTELAKNTAILTVGKLCTQCISFFLLPLYTAILSAEEYGTFDLLITYSTLLLPLVNWQLDQGLFRFMLDHRGDKAEQGRLFSTLLLSSTVQSVIYLILFACIEPLLNIKNAYFLLLYVMLHVYTALFLQFVRGLGHSIKYTIASFISVSTTTILNVIALVFLKMGLQGLFMSTLVSQLLTLLYLVISSKTWEYFSLKNIRPKLLIKVITYSFPLIPNNLAWWIVNASDRTIIAYFLGTAANGIYSIANKFPNVFINFYNILNLSWTETVSLHYEDEDRDEFLTEIMTSLFKLFAAACFVIVACLPFVFPILINTKYNASYNQILILMYAMLFRVLVGLYSCVYIAQKNAKKIAYTSISAAVINIMIDLLLINKIKIYAASISTLIAFLTMFIIRYNDVNKTVHMRIRKPIIMGSSLVGVILIVTYYCDNKIIQFVALCLTVFYAFLTNVDMLKSAVKLAKDLLRK
ncbi:lipopolysaccharide biosynthesis protein [Holdemania filiformis]|uniref:lipopolysaccharide biosynthesis protein n=1 Tax=Holdemania filiformis TaxID=61171 RepID=UPI002676433B|nr:oligosaccharide flippase family protein [Holdemania filiformis]